MLSSLRSIPTLSDRPISGVMMKNGSIAGCWFTGIVASLGMGAVNAQQHAGLLKQVLSESAKGNCPATLMSPMLKGTCESQMPGMSQALSAKGSINKTEFMGIQQSALGPAEVYKVTFSQGATMMWMINTGPDGKILVLWSPG